MPAASAAAGLISNSGSGCNSRDVVPSWRCSEWKNSKDRAPVVRTSGYFSASSGADTGLSGGSS